MELALRTGAFAASAPSGTFILNGERKVGDIFTLLMNGQLTNANIEDTAGVITAAPKFCFSGVRLGTVILPSLSSVGQYFMYQNGSMTKLKCRINSFNSNLSGYIGQLELIGNSGFSNGISGICNISNVTYLDATYLYTTAIYDNAYVTSVTGEKINVLGMSGAQAFRSLSKCKTMTLGTISTVNNSNEFNNLGGSLTADSEGFKAIITVGNTMSSFSGLARFPFAIPTTSKIVCSDGYLAHDGTSWVQHPNE